jgi:hypothetical protein
LGQAVDILEVVSQSIPILIRLFPATSGSFAKPASGHRIPIVGPPASADVRQRLAINIVIVDDDTAVLGELASIEFPLSNAVKYVRMFAEIIEDICHALIAHAVV